MRWVLVAAGLCAGLIAFAQTKSIGGDGTKSLRVSTSGAVVTETRGKVTVQTPPDNKVEELKAGMALRAGMIISTEEGASAVVVYPDGQICVLGERSMFRTIAYNYDPRQPDHDEVYLNLIVGSMRIVMGEIGKSNPSAVRVQVGMATMSPVSTPEGAATDASVVVQGGPVAVTVQEGRVDVRLPSGAPQQISSGQAFYLGIDGSTQVGPTSQILQQLGQGEVPAQLAALENFTPTIRQTVITLATVTSTIKDPETAGASQPVSDPAAQAILEQLASLPPTEEIQPQAPPPPALSSSGTPSTSAGGGGGGAVASPN